MDSAIAPDRHSASAERVDTSSVLVAKVSIIFEPGYRGADGNHLKSGSTMMCCAGPLFGAGKSFRARRQNPTRNGKYYFLCNLSLHYFSPAALCNSCNNISSSAIENRVRDDIVRATTILALKIRSIGAQMVCRTPISESLLAAHNLTWNVHNSGTLYSESRIAAAMSG